MNSSKVLGNKKKKNLFAQPLWQLYCYASKFMVSRSADHLSVVGFVLDGKLHLKVQRPVENYVGRVQPMEIIQEVVIELPEAQAEVQR